MYTSAQVSPGKDYFKFNLKFLFFVGLWRSDHWTVIKSRLYKGYRVKLHVLAIYFLIITAIGTYQNHGDMKIVISNLDKSIVGISYVLKILAYEVKIKNLQILVSNIMRSGDKITLKCQKRMSSIAIFYTGMVFLVTCAFTLSTFLEGEMVVDAWMPFDPLKSKQNLLLSAQVIGVVFIVPCSFRACAIQGILCSIIMYLCEQLVELQRRMRILKYDTHNDVDFRRDFRDIINKHRRLIGYANSMENLFKYFFMFHYYAMSVEMCLNAVMVTVIGLNEKKTLVSFGVFLLLTLINTYYSCYLGNEMIIQSEGIARAAYEAQWTSWPLDLQKELLTVIMIAQRPMKLSAGMYYMSLETYCQILYNGYSTFTVLHDMM